MFPSWQNTYCKTCTSLVFLLTFTDDFYCKAYSNMIRHVSRVRYLRIQCHVIAFKWTMMNIQFVNYIVTSTSLCNDFCPENSIFPLFSGEVQVKFDCIWTRGVTCVRETIQTLSYQTFISLLPLIIAVLQCTGTY